MNSTQRMVLEVFERRPDEWLTATEATGGLIMSERQAQRACEQLAEKGWLIRTVGGADFKLRKAPGEPLPSFLPRGESRG